MRHYLDIENHMLSDQVCDNEPERDEDREYETVRQEQIDEMRSVLQEIGATGMMFRDQAD